MRKFVLFLVGSLCIGCAPTSEGVTPHRSEERGADIGKGEGPRTTGHGPTHAKSKAQPIPKLEVNTKGSVVTADNATVRYVRRGQGAGAPALLVLEQGYIVLPLFRRLEAVADVVYMWGGAVPGKGSRPRTQGQVDATTIQDVELLRAKLGLRKPILIGNSHRGLIALEYARVHGRKLKSAVVVDPLIHHPGHLRESFSFLIAHLKKAGAKGNGPEIAFLKGLLTKKRYTLTDFFRSFEARTLYNKHHNILGYYDFIARLRAVVPTFRFKGARRSPPDPMATIRAMVQKGFRGEDLINYSVLGATSKIKTSICIIQGGRDPLTTATWAKALHAKLINSKFTLIPDAGHNPSFEAPRAFAKALIPCLGFKVPSVGVSSLLPAGWEPEVFKRTPDRSRLKTKLEAHYAMSMRPRGMISGACQFARGARKNTKLLRSLGVSPSEIGLFLKQTCRRFPPPNKK